MIKHDLKGTLSRDFWHFFIKNSTWALMNRQRYWGKCVSAWSLVKDYALTRGQRTQTTIRGHFRKLWRLLTDFKGTIRWKNILKCVYKPYSTNKKIWNHPSLMKNLRVRIVADFIDTQFLNFAIKYLCKNQKVCITNLAFSYGTQFEYFKQKNWSKISWPCPFNCCRKRRCCSAECFTCIVIEGRRLPGAPAASCIRWANTADCLCSQDSQASYTSIKSVKQQYKF